MRAGIEARPVLPDQAEVMDLAALDAVDSDRRVVTASAGNPALGVAYAAARLIHFDGMHYRTDIGRKGLKHSQSTTI